MFATPTGSYYWMSELCTEEKKFMCSKPTGMINTVRNMKAHDLLHCPCVCLSIHHTFVWLLLNFSHLFSYFYFNNCLKYKMCSNSQMMGILVGVCLIHQEPKRFTCHVYDMCMDCDYWNPSYKSWIISNWKLFSIILLKNYFM